MNKTLTAGVIILGAVLLPIGAHAAAPGPDLSGVWQMDSAKTHVSDGRTVTLSLSQTADHMKLNASVAAKTGEKTELRYDCNMDGNDCSFEEGAHKSKASIWIANGKITICKTDGAVGDLVTEWHMSVSPDGNTLTVEVEHVDPVAASETMVFSKKAGAQ